MKPPLEILSLTIYKIDNSDFAINITTGENVKLSGVELLQIHHCAINELVRTINDALEDSVAIKTYRK